MQTSSQFDRTQYSDPKGRAKRRSRLPWGGVVALVILGMIASQGLSVVATEAANPTVPGKPTAVTAIPYNKSAQVSWTAPSSGGTPISSYTVTITPSGGVCTPSPATATKCLASGLTNGIATKFRVSATNGVGTGTLSTPSSAVTPLPVPSVPTSVVAQGRNASALLHWVKSTTDGTPITSYTVTSTPTAKTCSPLSLSTPTCTVLNLKNGTSYRFRVVATNGHGNGPSSTLTAPVIPATIPDAPTNVVGVRGNAQAKVTWTAPSANGTPITKYLVVSTPTGKKCTTNGALTCTVKSLTNGMAYTFRVKATNGHGTGPTSTSSAPVIVASPPTVGPMITGTAGLNKSASVNWLPVNPANNGGQPITGYLVTAEIGVVAKGTIVVPATTTTGTVTGLVNGTTYRMTVAAVNVAGTGTATTSGNVTPVAVPTPPFSVTASPGDGDVEVTWSQPLANGSSITGYTVTSTRPIATVPVCHNTKTDCLFTHLTNGASYSFTVTATNANGTSAPSAATVAVTPSTSLPNPPTLVTAVGQQTGLKVSWTEPTGNASSITAYVAKATPTGKTCTLSTALTPSFTPATSRTCTINGLNYGTTYTVRVRSINGVGQSPASAPSAPVTLSTVPGAPLTVTAKAGNASAKVTWKAPPANGSPITSYTVTSTPPLTAPAGICTPTPPTKLTCTVKGLTNGTPYTFSVRATNKDGTGPPSTSSLSITPGTVPSAAPVVVSVTGTATKIKTIWDALPTTKDGGLPVTSYTVKIKGTGYTHSFSVPASTLTDTVPGLKFGVPFTVTVAAVNSLGAGPASAAKKVTLIGVPGPPLLVYGEPAGHSAVLVWGRATNDATPIITYTAVTTKTGLHTCTQDGTGQNSCIVTGLTNGTAYTFRVHATNGQGTGPTSTPVVQVTPIPVPDQVAKVTPTAGNASATVTIVVPTTGGSPITTYTVSVAVYNPHTGYTWWSIVTHKYTAPAIKTTTVSELVTGLSNGTQYRFSASAANVTGTGPRSFLSTIIVPNWVPFAPSGVTATVGHAAGKATVKWTKAPTDGSPITGSTVTSTPAGGTCTAIGTATACAVTGLTDGVSYKFTVKSANKDGTGPFSALSASYVPYYLPIAAPTLTGTSSGNKTITVTWSVVATATDGGSPITGYEVEATIGGVVKRSKFVAGAASQTATLTTLLNGTTYTVTVSAKNAAGTGPKAQTGQIFPATVPSAPLNPIAYAGDTIAEIIWTAPSANGTPIKGYTVTSTPPGKNCTPTPPTSLTCTVHGLTNGLNYKFEVRAHNLRGTGLTSTYTAKVTPGLVPSPPPAPTAVPHSGAATVTWSASPATNGSPVTSYVATSTPTKKTCTTATLSCSVANLANGTPYTFRVQAQNANGFSPPSLPSASVTPSKTPVAPATPKITLAATKATITWTAPTSNGTPITSYSVVSTTGTKKCSALVPALTCSISALVYGTAYKFKVLATNGAGAGPYSTFSLPVIPSTTPQAAPVITQAQAGTTTIVITWTDVPITHDGGSNITKYVVKVLHLATVVATLTSLATATTATFKNLIPGTAYTVQINAFNANGNGPVVTSTSLTPATVPGLPSSVVATPGNMTATVKWSAAPANGTAVISYTVTSTPGSFSCTTATLTCPVTALVDGTSYTFTVKATNHKGTGSTSTPSSPVTPISVPTAPVIQSAVATTTSVKLTWTASITSAGTPILSYLVTSTPVGKTCTPTPPTALSCTITSLTYGTSYKFKVKARSAAGTGPTSGFSSPVTPKSVPSAPTAVTATVSGKTVTVTWASATAHGTAIISYAVTGYSGPSTTHLTGPFTPTPATATSYKFASLTGGVPYKFKVKASNGRGSGPLSAASTPVTPASPPIAAPVITSDTAGSTTVVVQWTLVPATQDGASPITAYTIKIFRGATLITTITDPANTVKFTVNGATQGKSYTLKISAKNIYGTGPVATSAPVVPSTKPGAPTGVTATPFTKSALVKWAAAPTHGSAITSYTVTSSPGGKTCTPTPPTNLTCTVGGLTNNSSYTFTVNATNGDGSGLTSAASASVTPVATPTATTITSVTTLNTTATITWKAAVTSSGTTITSYTVTSTPAGFSCHPVPATTLHCPVPGLTYGSTYRFRVRAASNGRTGPTSPLSAAVVPFTKPGPPTGVTATASTKSALVKWTAALTHGSAVTSYTVTASPGGATCTPTPHTNLTCTVHGLANQTSYTFTVVATNAGGPSTASAPSTSVTPVATPTATTITSVTTLNTTATITWKAAVTSSGTAITGYQVTSTTGAITCHPNPATTVHCTVSGLTYGSSYRFKVRASNSAVTGPASPLSNPVVPFTKPGLPTGVTGTAFTKSALVKWSAAPTHGSAVTSYTVTAAPGGATCTPTPHTNLTCTVHGLANRTSYTFTVVATNAGGPSTASAPSTQVTPFTTPTTPSAPTATTLNTTATISWTAAVTSSGTPITGYTVASTPVGFTCKPHPTTTLSCIVSGLTFGTSYRFKLRSSNSLTSAFSPLSNAVVPAKAPAQPTGVSAVAHGLTATVAWTAPNNDGSAITGYTVLATTGIRNCVPTPPVALSCTVKTLVASNSYTFRVTATNAKGTSVPSVFTSSITASTVPGKPTSVSATAGNLTVLVKWHAATPEGTPVTGYTVTSTPTGKPCAPPPLTNLTCTVHGLTNGVTYTFTVKANNGQGPGLFSVPSGPVTPSASLPAAPTKPTVTTTATSATVSWIAPGTTGSTAITGYVVTSTPIVACPVAGTKTSCTVAGLTYGTSYIFKVRAKTGAGTSITSASSNPATPRAKPAAPTSLTTVGGNKSVLVKWHAPFTNGAAITAYKVTSAPTGVTCTPTPKTKTTCTVRGLKNGIAYKFTVTATNSQGTGPASATSSAVTPEAPKAVAPAAPVVVLTTTTAKITWNAPTAFGTTITSYAVTSTPAGKTCAPTVTTCTVNALAYGTSYTWRVHALDTAGTGATSVASNSVTPRARPGAPTTLTTVGSSKSVLVKWHAPAATNGTPITSYTVTSAPTGVTCTPTPKTKTTCTVHPLKNGIAYKFTVTATNGQGTGPASATSSAVTPEAPKPTAPATPTVLLTTTTAKISWNAPTAHGTTITGYTVTSTPPGKTCAPVGTTCTVTGLTWGTTYTWRVHAHDTAGTSTTSNGSQLVKPVSVPAPPAKPHVHWTGTTLIVSWSAATTHGTPIVSYQVQGTPGKKFCTPALVTTLSCNYPTLVPGTTYQFTVVATNGKGAGPVSPLSVNVKVGPVSTTPTGPHNSGATPLGYWEVASDGGMFSYGASKFFGSMGGKPLNSSIVGFASTPDGLGYWEVAADGGLFSFGDAKFHGSMGGKPLNSPIVDMATTPDGLGYWEVAADGGLFSFGDAKFHGSMGGKPLNSPIVSIATTPDGLGYWEVAADGGLFSFGDATFFGSMGGKPLNSPIVSIATTPDGKGYWEVAADGGLFSFGTAKFHGSMGGKPLVKPIVAMGVTPDGLGYWEVASDGGVFSFGDATFLGSMGGKPLDKPIVGMGSFR